jgi:hypothetical protein
MVKKFTDSRDFTYLSDMYVYIEQFGKKGHQIGRKIGDMLELLTMGYCYKSKNLKEAMKTEIALKGFTGAEHKVEFSFFKLDKKNNFILDKDGDIDQDNLIGFIECKKVGVEVTVYTETRDKNLELGVGESYEHSINPRWLNREIKIEVKCLKIDRNIAEISIVSKNTDKENRQEKQNDNLVNEKFKIKTDERFLITLVENGILKIIKPSENLCKLSEKVRLCHVFTLSNLTKKTSFKIDTCLTGPQTIEKAKQSALVSLDVRKKITGKWGKEQLEKADTFRNILVIGEVSHWEDKSRKVVIKTIDHNLVVPDSLLIQAFKEFYEKFGEDFLKYIDKNSFKTNNEVQRLINKVIEDNGGAVFYDLEDLKFKKIDKINNCLVVSDL